MSMTTERKKKHADIVLLTMCDINFSFDKLESNSIEFKNKYHFEFKFHPFHKDLYRFFYFILDILVVVFL